MAAEKKSKSDATPQAVAPGSEDVQRAFDAAEDKGYFGQSPDPTPREAYSVAGQLRGAATPETDPAAAAQADAAAHKLGSEAGQA
jgi:hypothetical protein